MGRLIDADKFRRILSEIQTDAEHFHNTQRRSDIGAVMALLDEQPTAYNVEKVVEEAKGISRFVAYGNYDRDIGMTHRVVPFDVLEKILKAGGINE